MHSRNNTKTALDNFDKSIVKAYIGRIDVLLSINILANPGHPLSRSALIETLIILNDLLSICDKENNRISFTDDVVITTTILDVTDLIRIFRNTACHYDSRNRLAGDRSRLNYVSFSYSQGKVNLLYSKNLVIGSPYHDDVAYYMGDKVLFLNRHLIKAFEEAKAFLLTLL